MESSIALALAAATNEQAATELADRVARAKHRRAVLNRLGFDVLVSMRVLPSGSGMTLRHVRADLLAALPIEAKYGSDIRRAACDTMWTYLELSTRVSKKQWALIQALATERGVANSIILVPVFRTINAVAMLPSLRVKSCV
jgi:hypothetical protein